ncbi:MAG: sensor histidine kinase [Verrucomicrobiales bacterium]|nr:sensor histidine kinase [Verrucomicrobiales bacterium]
MLSILLNGSAQAQLNSALEIRSLSAGAAEEGKAVDLSGVVIFSDPPATIFLQDETAGAFFRLNGRTPPKPGDTVRVQGQTFPGLFLPGIEETEFQITGHSGLPDPIPATYDDLLSGRYHYQHVFIEGIVRSIAPDEEGASLARIAVGSRIIPVRVEMPVPESSRLVDSTIRVSGLAAGRINDRRQLVAPYLRSSGWDRFEILRPGRTPEKAPLLTPEELMTFQVEGRAQNRVRIRGTVLAVFHRREVFLRSEDSAIAVRLLQQNPELRRGDEIEVAGFPEMGSFRAALDDAHILTIEPGHPPPEASATTIGELFEGTYDSDLVQLSGTVTDWYRVDRGFVITLRDGANALLARCPSIPDNLVVGAIVQATGICRVEETREAQYRSHPNSVSLLLRAPSDFSVLRAPPWWTPRHLAAALVILFVAMLAATLWITLLRRQVSRQTKALRNQIEKEAVLEERQRIAREFHDTLEQDLVGLSLRLDAATTRGTDNKLRSFLDGSRRLVTRIQSEARNLLFDLHEAHGSTTNLKEALEAIREELPPEVGPRIQIEAADFPPLPSRTAHHLKMMAREAVTNALKHADASLVEIHSRRDKGTLFVRVSDNGRGLKRESDTQGKSGHFGCMGIRERARRIGADVEWKSEPGHGTTLEVQLAVPHG